ncbi:MAG: malectin domain-containing carbohydrate-binding protein [Rhodothermales bacterium]
MALLGAAASPALAGDVEGELRVWHRVSVTFDGPQTSEDAAVNPFTDYRLQVTFTHGATGTTYVVPGFYAADGNAGETSATSGATWRVYFVPDQEGTWTYTASFRTGSFVAVSDDPNAGASTSFDGASGSFTVDATNKSGVDYRGKGMLRYVGGHHLQFAGDGSYFLKTGADTPENLLAYADFDGTYDTACNGDPINDSIHTFGPHVKHWTSGDPSWKSGKGKGLIGGINYLSSAGVNSVYFLTYNIDGGDGCDVWPWKSDQVRDRFDVSKLAQWEQVFAHMDAKGVQLHVILSERQNAKAIGPIGGADNSGLNDIRKLYYRELVARFGHHLALQWNLGEENPSSDPQKREFAGYIRSVDPYDHPITVHTSDGSAFEFYDALFGDPSFEATSLQAIGTDYNALAIHHRSQSAQYGRKWAVYGDEQAPNAGNERADELRKGPLWGNLMGGGAGVEWYTAFDLALEDWSRFYILWNQMGYARSFFEQYLPFQDMEPANDMTVNIDDYVLAKAGDVYAVYLPSGGTALLDLAGVGGAYDVLWYNPRTGGELKKGTVASVAGGALATLGLPPSETSNDWVAIVQSTDAPSNLPPTASFTYSISGNNAFEVAFDASKSDDPDGSIADYSWTFGDATTGTGEKPSHVYAQGGIYEVSLTVTDDKGATATALANVSVSGSTELNTVTISAVTPTAAEPGGEGNNGKFQIVRVGDLSESLTVSFAIGGTATMGEDYETLDEFVTLSPGDDVSNFAIRPLDDADFEGTETVVVTLTAGAGYQIDPSGPDALLELLDNDAALDLAPIYRVNAGGSAESDAVLVWDRDTKNKPSEYVNADTGDNAVNRYHFGGVNNTDAPSAIYQRTRFDPAGGAEMQWDFPVDKSGLYDVRLYFADTDNATRDPGSRVFDVTIEGTLVLDNYDVVADVGFDTAVMKRFVVDVSDGNIDIDFGHEVDQPFISAIEILPTAGTSPGSGITGDRVVLSRAYEQATDAEWELYGVPVATTSTGMLLAEDAQEALSYVGTSYQDVTALVAGVGYWMRSEEDHVRRLDGLRMDSVRVAVRPGWNLIAGPSCSMDVAAIDGSELLVPGTLYSYRGELGYYPMHRIEQGLGYWVMAHTGGELRMRCQTLSIADEAADPAAALDAFGRVSFRDANGAAQALYFDADMPAGDLDRFALPPQPPGDVFDVRFASQRWVTPERGGLVQVRSSAFPLEIQLDRLPAAGANYVVTLMKKGQPVEDLHLSAGQPVLIDDFTVEALKIQPADQWAATLPVAFSVEGNYPNPFADATSIVMDLPEGGAVTVDVFDMLGRRVVSLPAQTLPAGRGRRIAIEAAGLASGVYLYRVEARMDSRTETFSGKMILRR